MIRRQSDGCAERSHASQRAIDSPIELVSFLRTGGILVLNVVGEREIHQIRLFPLEDLDAGFQHEQRKIRRVFIGKGLADVGEAIVDAIVLLRAFVG